MSWFGFSRVCAVALLALTLNLHFASTSLAARPGVGDGVGIEVGRRVVSPFILPKWAATIRREVGFREPKAQRCRTSANSVCGQVIWRRFLDAIRGSDEVTLIEQVNSYVNKTQYRTDISTWGQEDYWAAPGEFFARGGDCEDYAIAKYYSLKSLGIPIDAMRIVVLRDQRRKRGHAVLIVRTGDRDVILDNLQSRPLSWREVPHYRPVYSVNEQFFWLRVNMGKR